MDKKKIESVQRMAAEIDNFTSCYSDCKLWSRPPDGDVHPDDILFWLIENPHMAEIALRIKKLDK